MEKALFIFLGEQSYPFLSLEQLLIFCLLCFQCHEKSPRVPLMWSFLLVCFPLGHIHPFHHKSHSLSSIKPIKLPFQVPLATNLEPLKQRHCSLNLTVSFLYYNSICFPLFGCQVMSDSSWPHGLQHARLPCPSPSPRACPSSCPCPYYFLLKTCKATYTER